MRLPERVFILAGNATQYRWFVNQVLRPALSAEGYTNLSHDLVYVSDPIALRGYRNPWGYIIGTWRQRSDAYMTIQMLNAAGSTLDDFIEVEGY